MSQVPQHLIDEATRRGIVPGAQIRDDQMHVGTVPPIEEWSEGAHGSIFLNHEDDLRAFNANTDKWATVITTAPSQQLQAIGLQEGDAVECGPAMRAALIELAKELGVNVTSSATVKYSALTWWCKRIAGHRGGDVLKNYITPEAFIAKMRVTASQPKPITIGGNTVKFTKGEINFGCTTISNETVRAIAAKLID